MDYILLERFKYARATVNEVLAKMWLNLEKYKAKPGASETVVQIQVRQFDEIENYLTVSDALILHYDELRAENEILKRKLNDYEARHKANAFLTAPDKEFLRDQSVNRARNRWPNLY